MYFSKTVYCCSYCKSVFDKASQAEECDNLGEPLKLQEVIIGDEILVSAEIYHPSSGKSVIALPGKVIYKTISLNKGDKPEHVYFLIVEMKNDLGVVVCERGVIHAFMGNNGKEIFYSNIEWNYPPGYSQTLVI